MAKHEVGLWIDHEIPIGKVDVEFPVKADGKSLGRVRVSRGGIAWVPARRSKTGYNMTWEQFGEHMESQAKPTAR